MAQRRRFTIYDVMEARGVFDSNPANVQARDPDGLSLYVKQEYPKMMYEPEGKERISVPAEVINTPYGPQRVGEQRQIICQEVKNSAEEEKLRKLGWHDHPAKAIAAGGGEAPEISSAEQIESLKVKLAAVQQELDAAQQVRRPHTGKTSPGALGL